MEQHCIRHTELPGASRLFSDLLYQFDRVERFYPYPPYDPESYRTAAQKILYPEQRRAKLVAALRASNPGNPSLDRLAERDTVAVVTGQQVGLFGGPLYTIFKALTAARLAETLTASGIGAAPVFWLATEDHDLDEVNRYWTFDAEQRAVSLTTSAQPHGGPVGPVPLQNTPLDGLRQSLEGHPFADEVFPLFASCYADGQSFGVAFQKLLQEVLRPYNILFLDPLAPAIREIAAPFLSRALGQSPDLVQAVQQRSRELESAGYHAQVHLESHATLFFRLENGKRIALKRTDDRSLEEFAARAENLSPNALLRPVMQDYLLPTVAYVGGPAELAYLAQAEPLYSALLGRMPVAVHRASFTLLDRRAAKLMTRYRIDLRDVTAPGVTLRETMASRLIPAELADRFEAARRRIAMEMDSLAAPVASFDPSLGKAFDKSRAKAIHQIEKLQRKAARETFRRDDRATADAEYLHNLVYPHRRLQERFYGMAPLLARHGMDLIGRVYDAVKPHCPDHQILALD